MRRAVVLAVTALLPWLLLHWLSAPANARSDPELVRAGGVDRILTLGGVVLYRDAGGWTRLVHGRRSAAGEVPPRATASSIGRDGRGRIVVTFSRWPRYSGSPVFPRWWAYDVRRDSARRLSIATRQQCFAESVAIWRARLAFAEGCWQRENAGGSDSWSWGGDSIVFVDAGRTRRATVGGFSDTQLAVRGRSVAALVNHDDQQTVWRISDQGRWCPEQLDRIDPEYDDLGPITIRHGSVAWGTSDQRWEDSDPRYGHFLLTDVAMSGRCPEAPRVRLLDAGIPDRGVQAAAIGTSALLYATDRGIHRQRLPPAGSTARPRSDDFEDPERISNSLPVEVFGRIGYATAQPGEPIHNGWNRTVWYALTAAHTETIYLNLTYGWAYNVFTGSTVSALTPLLPWGYGTGGACVFALDVEAGRTYSLSVGAAMWESKPNFRPFTIRISRRATLPACSS